MKYLIISTLALSLLVSGCTTSQQTTAINAEGVVITTVDTGMKGWALYVNAGKASPVQIANVQTAYNAYYTAQLAAQAALSTLVTSGSTNTVDVATANASVLTAENSLLALLNQYIK